MDVIIADVSASLSQGGIKGNDGIKLKKRGEETEKRKDMSIEGKE